MHEQNRNVTTEFSEKLTIKTQMLAVFRAKLAARSKGEMPRELTDADGWGCSLSLPFVTMRGWQRELSRESHSAHETAS